jgi:hypothetical protein
MTDARLVFKTRSVRVGGVVEMVVWKVPKPVPPSEHAFKYRLVYVKNGHLGEVETAYRFLDVETLMADFLRDVEAFE